MRRQHQMKPEPLTFDLLSQFLPLLLLRGEASCQLIGQRVLLSVPEEVRGRSRLALLRRVNKERAELDGQSRAHQADAPRALRAGVIHPSAARVHVQRLGPEGDGQLLCAAAVRQLLLLLLVGGLQQVGEDHGSVVAAQEVPLPPAQRQEGEVVLVAAALIQPQTAEEEDQELFV